MCLAILAECLVSHRKQATKNLMCSCGKDLVELKRPKKVRYSINDRRPDGKQKRQSVDSFEVLNGCSIKNAQKARSKPVAQKAENRILDMETAANITFQKLSEWYGMKGLKRSRLGPGYRQIKIKLERFNPEFENRLVPQFRKKCTL
jgi:hypothetical protein